MRLSEFIVSHREPILAAWVAFDRSSLPSADGMSLAVLRDHAGEMLDAIATDLRTKQSDADQAKKSEGKSDADPSPATPDTAAQAHGAARAESGFTVEQMVSEYRALRASVIRLWVAADGMLAPADVEDLVRFNEAIDQALAESTSRFMQDLDRSKEIFLAMLGHDLRTPLGAIIGSAHVIEQTADLPKRLLKSASLIVKSGRRMDALVSDLLDFTRSRLGRGIPIVRSDINIAKVCGHAVDEIHALHPGRVVTCEASGDLHGQWDEARVSQALVNLIDNAVEHGSDTTPIHVTVRGDGDAVALAVQNRGPIIPATELNRIFDPMYRIDDEKGERTPEPAHNLGLGLYIAERIVAAHEGTIGVESSQEHGTTFTMHLPRRMPPAAQA
jgi:signal transduction histidine kinase